MDLNELGVLEPAGEATTSLTGLVTIKECSHANSNCFRAILADVRFQSDSVDLGLEETDVSLVFFLLGAQLFFQVKMFIREVVMDLFLLFCLLNHHAIKVFDPLHALLKHSVFLP